MHSKPLPRSLFTCATLLPLLLLGACGAGNPPADAAAEDLAAAPAAASTAAGISAPAPTPPVDTVLSEDPGTIPASSETIRLAPAYTPLANTGGSAPYWPAWPGGTGGKTIDGIACLLNGNWHKHALISIYKDGQRLGLPNGIGSLHTGCYHAYEMHVHDVSGIIHMEADTPRDFKLGQWFSLWQQTLSRTNTAGLAGPVRFYIIDNATITRYDGDPYEIRLLPHREVVIVTGTTMTEVPKYQWPAGS